MALLTGALFSSSLSGEIANQNGARTQKGFAQVDPRSLSLQMDMLLSAACTTFLISLKHLLGRERISQTQHYYTASVEFQADKGMSGKFRLPWP
jgi:hypothetical protein